MLKNLLLSLSVLLALSSCTSGGDDDSGGDGDGLSTNACSVLRSTSSRIINGSECSENDNPVVQLTLVSGPNAFVCSGTIIGARHVLTAAHCFLGLNIQTGIVRAGNLEVAMESFEVHPRARADTAAQAIFDDAAIVTLRNPISIKPVPLVVSRNVRSGDVIQIFGYGKTEDEQPGQTETIGRLRSGEMRVDSSDKDLINARFTGEGSNTCEGDSGGPALLQIGDSVGIVGITSSGILTECGVGDLSKFSNVQGSSILDFITRNVPDVGAL